MASLARKWFFVRNRIGIVNKAGGFVFVGFGVLVALSSKK
jgi:threonine/homoserine/homoserine lactone efflux protein